MQRVSTALCALTLGFGPLVLSACGATTGSTTTVVTRPATPAPTPAAAPRRVTISAPAAHATVDAHRTGRVTTASVHIAGRSAPDRTIRVQARPCTSRRCIRFVFPTTAGTWHTSITVAVGATRRRLTVTAGYADQAVRATRELVVRPPRTPPASHRRASPSAAATQPAVTTAVPVPSQRVPIPTGPATTGTGTRGALLLVGDSLAVGIQGTLPADLPGWRVTIDGQVSRSLDAGMAILAATRLPSDGSTVLAFSLFTNDDPSHTAQLQSAVEQSLARAGTDGCVIWATIVRPPYGGVSYDAANHVLEALARSDPRMQLVPWAAEIAARPSLVGADGVHPTPAGYALRAQLYVGAARACR